MSTLKLGLLISATGGKQTVAELLAIEAAAKKTAESADRFAGLASVLGKNIAVAENLAKTLRKTPEELQEAIATLQRLKSVGASNDTVLTSMAVKFGLSADQAKRLQAEVAKIPSQAPQVASFGGGIGALAFKFNNVIQAMQSLAAAAKPVYDSLIGSNEALNAQILSSGTNLASATRIFEGANEIKDPTEKILATRPALTAALKQIEVDTESLVGVTSQDVNELFQITLTNASRLNQQSKQFADPIAAATSLTKGWAASLKVVGVPLDQARQEINSILKGQIDGGSVLAKNLGITNQQVEKWRGQGVLVDELNKKLETFVAGNAIAARSIDGIGSNITDIFQRLGRSAGEPFLEPIINALDAVYKYLKANESGIKAFTEQIASAFLQFGNTIGPALEPLGTTLLDIGENAGGPLISALKGLLSLVAGLVTAISPIANLFAQIISQIVTFAGTDIGGIAVQALVATAALGKMGFVVGNLVAAFPAFIAQFPALNAAFTYLSGTSVQGGIVAFKLFATQALGATSTAVTALATGGIPALTAAFPGLVAGLGAASTAALPLAAALLPLAGAIALTFIVKGTQDMKVAQEQIDALAPGTANLSNEALNYASKLKALAREQEKNGSLTDEQKKKQAGYVALAKGTVSAIDQQIAALKEATPANEAQTNTIKIQIAEMEAQKALLLKNSGGIRLQAKALEVLGSSYEQLGKKAANGKRAIAQAETTEDADKAAKDFADTIKQQQELGQITAAQAETELKAIADNKGLSVDIQRKAADDIIKIRKSELDTQIKDLKGQTDLIQAEADAGSRPPIEAAAEITKLKKQQLDLQLADVNAAIEAEKLRIKELTDFKTAELQKQLDETLLAIQAQEGAIAGGGGSPDQLNKLNAQAGTLQASIEKETAAAATATSPRLKELQTDLKGVQTDIEKESADSSKRARDARKQELDLQVEDIKSQSSKIEAEAAAGKRPPVEVAQEITKLKKQELNLQLADIETSIAEEAAAIASGKGSKTRLKKLQSERQGAQANIQKEEIEGEKRVQEAKIKVIEDAYAKTTSIAKSAEILKNTEIAKLEATGVITSEQAEGQKLQATKLRIASELAAEQTKAAALAQLAASSPEEQKKLDAQKRASADKIAQLQGEAVKNEVDIRKNAISQVTADNDRAQKKLSLADKERIASLAEQERAGTITKAEQEAKKAEYTADRIAQELALEQDLLAKLQAQPQSKERDEAILSAKQQLADKRVALVEAETAKEEQIRKAAIDRIDKANQAALDKIELAGQQRLIDTQRLVNKGVLTEEAAAELKAKNDQTRLKAELSAAQQQQAVLAGLVDSATTGKAREEAEKSVVEARKKTNAITLQLLESEDAAQKATIAAAQAAIQKQLAEKNRAFDRELLQINALKQARASASAAAELASQREALAAETVTKALGRQNQLSSAKANLQKATNELAQSEVQAGIDNSSRAAELRKQLDDQNLSTQERAAIEQQLNAAGFSAQSSILEITRNRLALENGLADRKRAALVAEQEQARASLALENKRNELAANRAVTEARIAEIKAKAGVLDAQAALQEQRINDQKAIAAAQGQLATAQKGGKKDEIANATLAVDQAKQAATTGQAQAQEGIALAQQQVVATTQGVADATADKQAQTELAVIANQTLVAQQQSALVQFNAAESARVQAQQLTLAKAAAEGIAAAQAKGNAPTAVARRLGGTVEGGGAIYEIAEEAPEIYRSPKGDFLIPDRGFYQFPDRGEILNGTETAALMANIPAASVAIGNPRASVSSGGGGSGAALLAEMKALRQDIGDRPPPQQSNQFNIIAETDPYERALELNRKMARQKNLFNNL
jgi:hypothetical protein